MPIKLAASTNVNQLIAQRLGGFEQIPLELGGETDLRKVLTDSLEWDRVVRVPVGCEPLNHARSLLERIAALPAVIAERSSRLASLQLALGEVDAARATLETGPQSSLSSAMLWFVRARQGEDRQESLPHIHEAVRTSTDSHGSPEIKMGSRNVRLPTPTTSSQRLTREASARLRIAAGIAHSARHQSGQAVHAFDDAIRLADGAAPQLLATANALLAGYPSAQSESGSVALEARLRDLVSRAVDLESQVFALEGLADFLERSGRYAEALEAWTALPEGHRTRPKIAERLASLGVLLGRWPNTDSDHAAPAVDLPGLKVLVQVGSSHASQLRKEMRNRPPIQPHSARVLGLEQLA